MMVLYSAMIDTPENVSKFQQIYDSYKNTMFSVAFNLTNNIHTSEDIVQMSLIKLIDILHKIDSRDIPRPKCKNLVITITKNTAIDVIRKESKIVASEMIELGAGSEKSAEDYYFEASDFQHLVCCINEMDEKYRDVLRLRMLHNLTAKETARILNTNEQTINMRYMRAKRILAEKVKEYKNA